MYSRNVIEITIRLDNIFDFVRPRMTEEEEKTP